MWVHVYIYVSRILCDVLRSYVWRIICCTADIYMCNTTWGLQFLWRISVLLLRVLCHFTVFTRLVWGTSYVLLQCVAVCCSMLQCVAVCCSVVWCRYNMLAHFFQSEWCVYCLLPRTQNLSVNHRRQWWKVERSGCVRVVEVICWHYSWVCYGTLISTHHTHTLYTLFTRSTHTHHTPSKPLYNTPHTLTTYHTHNTTHTIPLY